MDIYAQHILDHYKNPRNKGKIKSPCLTCEERNTSCGDVVLAYVLLNKDKVKKIKFEGNGCAISQATTSILSEKLIGLNKKEVLAIKFSDIQKILGIEISERRYKCAMTGLNAIQKALLEK